MIPIAAYYLSLGIDPKIGAQGAYLAGILRNRIREATREDIASARDEFINLEFFK